MKFAILGLGGRGNTYAHFIKYYGHEVVAVCDIDPKKIELAKEYGVDESLFFTSEEVFFNQGKLADALVIATMDSMHYMQTIKALNIGYHILLEKPIAMSLEECIEIENVANQTGKKVVVCHELRFAPIYQLTKDIIDSHKYGKLISITQTEHIGYYHYAHSYVRGNWRNEKVSAPLVIAKNCHDLDLFCWLSGKKPISVSSIGSLQYFKKENAPKDSADFCYKCKYKDSCKYSSFLIYNNAEYEALAGLAHHGQLGNNKEEINKNLSDESNSYARCVFKCDNDMCDNQMVNVMFEDNISAHLLSIAFAEDIERHFTLYFEEGTLTNTLHHLEFQHLNGEKEIIDVPTLVGGYAHHGGGDVMIIKHFVEYIETGNKDKSITDISSSVDSHILGFLADKSQKEGGTLQKIDFKIYKK